MIHTLYAVTNYTLLSIALNHFSRKWFVPSKQIAQMRLINQNGFIIYTCPPM